MKDKNLKKQKKFFKKENIKTIGVIGLVGIGVALLSTEVDATAIERLSTQSDSLKGLVKGAVGEVALFAASIAGAFVAFMKGNIMMAMGIFVVGMLFSWHLENISVMFT